MLSKSIFCFKNMHMPLCLASIHINAETVGAERQLARWVKYLMYKHRNLHCILRKSWAPLVPIHSQEVKTGGFLELVGQST